MGMYKRQLHERWGSYDPDEIAEELAAEAEERREAAEMDQAYEEYQREESAKLANSIIY